MYPNSRAQRGSALVTAVFIVVVMLLLAQSIAQLLRSGSEAVVYEVQGSRTLLAAQSALELSLTQLFPLNSTTTTCAALTLNYSFSGVALAGCSATLSCKAYSDSESVAPLFSLTSSASCVAGEFTTQRTISIEVQ